MPAGSLLALLDDVASVLDDVALLTKVATKKTAGVLGDDLALNAQQVAGVRASRELPVVWAVAKGSMVNKAILVPAALAISAFAPWAVTPLLMIGGAVPLLRGLREGRPQVPRPRRRRRPQGGAQARGRGPDGGHGGAREGQDQGRDPHRLHPLRRDHRDRARHGGGAAFGIQVAVLVGIAILMTVGVYGLVAGIVKLDDAGLHLAGAGTAQRARCVRSAAASSRRAVADEVPVGGRHRRDVPRRRRHPRARLCVLASTVPSTGQPGRRAAGRRGRAQGVRSMLLNLLTGLVAGAIVVGIVWVDRWLPAIAPRGEARLVHAVRGTPRRSHASQPTAAATSINTGTAPRFIRSQPADRDQRAGQRATRRPSSRTR